MLDLWSIEWDNPLPQPATDTVLDVPQDMVSHSSYQGPLLTHIQFATDQDLQISFYRAAL